MHKKIVRPETWVIPDREHALFTMSFEPAVNSQPFPSSSAERAFLFELSNFDSVQIRVWGRILRRQNAKLAFAHEGHIYVMHHGASFSSFLPIRFCRTSRRRGRPRSVLCFRFSFRFENGRFSARKMAYLGQYSYWSA